MQRILPLNAEGIPDKDVLALVEEPLSARIMLSRNVLQR